MITEEQKQRAIENSKAAARIDRGIFLKLPKGWQEVRFVFAFCKICHRGLGSLQGIKSPGGRSYYHRGCVEKSPLFKKMGGFRLF